MENNHNEPNSSPETNYNAPSAPSTLDLHTKTEEFSSSLNFNQNSLITALSYVGPLVIVPILTQRDNPFTKFHIKQGLVVFIIWLILYVIGGAIHFLWPIIMLINFGLLCLSILGIVYVLQGKEKALPIVGPFASHIKI